MKSQAPAEELSTEQAEAAPVKTPKSKAAKPKAAKSTAKSKGRKKSAKSVDADSEDFDFDDDGGEDIAGVIDDEDADYEDIPELDEVEDIEAVEDVGEEADEDGAADAESAPSEAEPEAAPKKTRRSKKSRAARDKALMEAMKHGYGAAEESTEDRRSKLIKLISLGKERGYVTYSEINDNIPNTLLDEDAIETIVNILGNLNIAVHEVAPDEEQLLIQGGAEGVSDEDAEAEAEAALSTVESEFGRTTDPVRIYMREMGSVELLSRQDEIEISKRIEDGLKHMVLAIARCPVTVHEILESAERIRSGETPIDEVVDGIVTPDDQKNVVGAVEDETDMGASAMTVGQLEDLKEKALRCLTVWKLISVRSLKPLTAKGRMRLNWRGSRIRFSANSWRFALLPKRPIDSVSRFAGRLALSAAANVRFMTNTSDTSICPANGSSPISFPMLPASAGLMRWRLLIPTRRRSFFICGRRLKKSSAVWHSSNASPI